MHDAFWRRWSPRSAAASKVNDSKVPGSSPNPDRDKSLVHEELAALEPMQRCC